MLRYTWDQGSVRPFGIANPQIPVGDMARRCKRALRCPTGTLGCPRYAWMERLVTKQTCRHGSAIRAEVSVCSGGQNEVCRKINVKTICVTEHMCICIWLCPLNLWWRLLPHDTSMRKQCASRTLFFCSFIRKFFGHNVAAFVGEQVNSSAAMVWPPPALHKRQGIRSVPLCIIT